MRVCETISARGSQRFDGAKAVNGHNGNETRVCYTLVKLDQIGGRMLKTYEEELNNEVIKLI